MDRVLPFKRYKIAEQDAAPLPTTIRSLPNWDLFLRDLEPVVWHVRQADARNQRGFWIILLLLMVPISLLGIKVMVQFSVIDPFSNFVVTLLLICLALLASMALVMPLKEHTKRSNVKKFQEVCGAHQAEFNARGYTVECRLEAVLASLGAWAPLQSVKYWLYVLPHPGHGTAHTVAESASQSYVQFEIWRQGGFCQGYESSNNLSSSEYLPAGLERIPLEEWKTFWTRMHEHASDFLLFQRLHSMIQGLFWMVITLGMTKAMQDTPIFRLVLYLVGISAVLVKMCYVNRNLQTTQQDFQSLLIEYQTFFRNHNVYMEWCQELGTGILWPGKRKRQYLCFYDATPVAQDASSSSIV